MTFPSAPRVSVVVLCFGNEYPSENLNSATSLHASEHTRQRSRDDARECAANTPELLGKECGDGCGREGPSGTSLHARTRCHSLIQSITHPTFGTSLLPTFRV
jgi:hypothetical protein